MCCVVSKIEVHLILNDLQRVANDLQIIFRVLIRGGGLESQDFGSEDAGSEP